MLRKKKNSVKMLKTDENDLERGGDDLSRVVEVERGDLRVVGGACV